jgi:hypothetical protein
MSDHITKNTNATDPDDTKTTADSQLSSEFDDLKLPQNFDEILRAKRVLTAVPLRKPAKHLWIRTHPSWEQTAAVLKLSGERDDLWILKNAIVPGVPPDLVVGMTFVPYITRQGEILMWPLRLPAVGRADDWATSALAIAQVARTTWVQVHSNQRVGAYEYNLTPLPLDEPDWGETPWDRLRELAFRPKLIVDLDHPVLVAVLQGK